MAKYPNTPWIHEGWEVQFKQEDLVHENVFIDILCEKIKNKEPLNLVRSGDGEYTVLSQDLCLSQDWLAGINEKTKMRNVSWYGSTSYCGVALPDLETRDKLIEAYKNADFVAVFPDDDFADKCFSAINFKPKNLIYAFGNLYFCYNPKFVKLLKDNPPLLIGSKAKLFAEYLSKELNIDVPNYYTDVTNPQDIDKAVEYMVSTPHDWSLVSAGVNAKIIAHKMARDYGKICVDSGQLIDVLLDLEDKYYDESGKKRYYLNKEMI
jgi:hypothetical protein